MLIPQAAPLSEQTSFLRPFWGSVLGPAWLVSLLVFAVIASVRFFVIFSPWPLQELFFVQTVALWAVPFIFLTPSGRRQIGFSEHGLTPAPMLFSAIAGAACGFLFFALGMLIYHHSPDNWCISIRNYLHLDEMRGAFPPLGLFALFALPAIFLNPVGEEILFRGFMSEAFSRRFGPTLAVGVSSVLFAVLYLYIHGIWLDASGFHIRLGSAALACLLMASVGCVFSLCRTLSGSLWPAMAAHAAFNLALLAAAIYEFAG